MTGEEAKERYQELSVYHDYHNSKIRPLTVLKIINPIQAEKGVSHEKQSFNETSIPAGPMGSRRILFRQHYHMA
jgi:hypothetical protein